MLNELKDEPMRAYDDSSWTSEEQLLLAARAGSAIGSDDMGEYDDFPGNPA